MFGQYNLAENRVASKGPFCLRVRKPLKLEHSGAILFCRVCCRVFIIEDRRFRNTVKEILKESLLIQQQFYH